MGTFGFIRRRMIFIRGVYDLFCDFHMPRHERTGNHRLGLRRPGFAFSFSFGFGCAVPFGLAFG